MLSRPHRCLESELQVSLRRAQSGHSAESASVTSPLFCWICGFQANAILTLEMSSRSTATIAVAVIDDEKLAREELAFLLRSFPEVEVVRTAENGVEPLDLISRVEPDLVFLDVQ